MQGTNLGPYEILEQLGAGGMGEVWLAQDTRLGRKVAVKVLPPQFASDPERLARFEQESRAAAALNHPNIAAVFDVGNQPAGDGTTTHYMVQEHLQGHSLRTVLEKGGLDLRRALALGAEIAEALKAAHRAGIVHRDLKPENVFVTEDGHAKVLDFGLAKLTEMAAGPLTSQSMSPTVLGTQAGAIMGTAGYMAPEQVQGEEVDARADVFAFGCVLWEMVTGKRAFAGKSVPHTLHKILDEGPEGQDSNADQGLPLRLRWLLQRTLAKGRDARAQSAADVLAELRQIAGEVESGSALTLAGLEREAESPTDAAPSRSPWKLALPLAAATLLIGALGSWLLQPAPPEPIVRRFDVAFPQEGRPTLGLSRGITLSPDGRWLAFEAERQLWLRGIGDLEATPLRGTEGAVRTPSFSPDSMNLAFWIDGQMKRLPVGGGAPVTLGDAPSNATGAAWADDGFVYVGQGGNIVRLPATGGEPAVIVEAADGEELTSPHLLPGGEWLLVTRDSASESVQVIAVSLRDGERRPLVQGSDGRYVPTGHLLFGVDGDLMAQPFDLGAVAVYVGPAVVVEGVHTTGSDGLNYAVSAGGDLLYRPGTGGTNGVLLAWIGRDATVEPLAFPPRAYDWGRVSPDGSRIAVQIADGGGTDVWVYEIARGGQQRLTSGGGFRPVWSADGAWVYFSNPDGEDIWRRRADLSLPAERVLEMEGRQLAVSFSADGKLLAFESAQTNDRDIYVLELDGGAEPRAVAATPADESYPSLSPDGRYLAYVSNESGEQRVYVRELASNRQWPISTGIAFFPAWTPDGKELVFRQTTGEVLAVQVTLDPEFSATAPAQVSQLPTAGRASFTIDHDGSRFLFYAPPDATGGTAELPHLTVVLNWFEELKQRVPVER